MKIGILTFHCAQNYGALLQCYATQEFLKSKGYDVEVINYCPDYLLEPYPLFNTKRLARCSPMGAVLAFIKELIHFPKRCYQRCAFRRFTDKYLTLTSKVVRQSIPSSYDVYVVGSDQIWNTKITESFDNVYFCDFPFVKGEKRYIAYAASMGKVELVNEQVKEFFHKALRNFDAVSVRECGLRQALQPLSLLPVAEVLDPTLMVDSQLWKDIASPIPSRKKYVVVYQVRHNENTLRIAKDIAKQINAKVLILGTWFSLNRRISYRSVSPEGFVKIIRNAACVVTTSFHGTAFSVIFNRPFYAIRLNDGGDSRTQSLLENLGLQERLVEMDSSPIFSRINYSEANAALNILRDKSQEFLLSSLKKL